MGHVKVKGIAQRIVRLDKLNKSRQTRKHFRLDDIRLTKTELDT